MAEDMPAFYAHCLEGTLTAERQTLEEHLKGTAEKAAQVASEFNSSRWAFLAGLWHDLGKYSPAFQRKLFGEKENVLPSASPPPVVNSTSQGRPVSSVKVAYFPPLGWPLCSGTPADLNRNMHIEG